MLFDLKLSLAITAIKALQVHSLSAELMRRSLEKMILTQGSAPLEDLSGHTLYQIRIHWGYEVGGRHLVQGEAGKLSNVASFHTLIHLHCTTVYDAHLLHK